MTAEQSLSAAEAEDWLPDGPVVHTITQSGNEMDGEDWPRDRMLALLRDATVIRRPRSASGRSVTAWRSSATRAR